MNRLASVFLAMGILAAACGDDGSSNSQGPGASGASGASGAGTAGSESNGGEGPALAGGAAGYSGSPATPQGGEGGSPSPVVEGGHASGGDLGSVSLGGAFEEVRGDPPLDPACGDFSEHEGRVNVTGLSFDKQPLTFCGRLNAYQFQLDSEAGYGLVDDDTFRFQALEDGDYLVSIEFPEEAPPQDDFTGISVNPGFSGGGVASVKGKRGALWVQFYEGVTATIDVVGYATAELERSIPYKLHIRKDSPASRCTTVKLADAKQSYSEAHDGAANKGNDVVHYQFSQAQQPTAANDAPEPSGVVLNIGDHSLLQGNAALVDYGDDYYDTDMFAFKTGTSDVVTLRLDWPSGKGTDLDLMLFNADDLTFRYLANSLSYALRGPELFTLLVEPNTTYWAYVAGSSTSDDGGIPAAYDVTMCGEKFSF